MEESLLHRERRVKVRLIDGIGAAFTAGKKMNRFNGRKLLMLVLENQVYTVERQWNM